MLVGNDISHWQGQIDWETYKKNTHFVIAKATDGASMIDSWYGFNRQQVRLAGLPFGSYHFVEGQDVNTEAERFCSVIDGDPIREGEILCLDYEIALKDPVSWCKTWLDVVSGHFGGMKPYIYLNQSVVKDFDWTPIINAGYPLWLASYQADGSGNTGKWPFMALQQTSSTQQVPGISGNVDRDVFFGDVSQFKAYGYKKPVVTPPPTPEPPQPSSEPIPMPPVPEPTPVDPCAGLKTQLKAIYDTLYGSGWWWVKWTAIKKLLPK